MVRISGVCLVGGHVSFAEVALTKTQEKKKSTRAACNMMGWARVRWLIVIFSLSGVLDTAAGLPRNAAPNATLLSHLLLERYSPLVPPISPDGKPVAVELDMTLLEISEVSRIPNVTQNSPIVVLMCGDGTRCLPQESTSSCTSGSSTSRFEHFRYDSSGSDRSAGGGCFGRTRG